MASPGVVADSNGFFHPIGDHAQTQFSIDNQPITDQQSRVYSNQISPDAVQSMEVISGVAPGGIWRQEQPHRAHRHQVGSRPAQAGRERVVRLRFIQVAERGGEHRRRVAALGNFLSFSGTRTDRFLDPPEFTALHDAGNSAALFDRLDAKTGDLGTFHLNLQAARSAFDVPNTFDQNDSGQAQHQQINTFNVAPGYSQVFGSKTLFTANGFVRRDHLTYTPSPDPFADQPGASRRTAC